jgi:hypothetical protein
MLAIQRSNVFAALMELLKHFLATVLLAVIGVKNFEPALAERGEI